MNAPCARGPQHGKIRVHFDTGIVYVTPQDLQQAELAAKQQLKEAQDETAAARGGQQAAQAAAAAELSALREELGEMQRAMRQADEAAAAARQRAAFLDAQAGAARAAEADAQRALADVKRDAGRQEAVAASRIGSLEVRISVGTLCAHCFYASERRAAVVKRSADAAGSAPLLAHRLGWRLLRTW